MIQNNMFNVQGVQQLQMKSAAENKTSTPAESIQKLRYILTKCIGICRRTGDSGT